MAQRHSVRLGFEPRACVCFGTLYVATALGITVPLKRKLLNPAKDLSNLLAAHFQFLSQMSF